MIQSLGFIQAGIDRTVDAASSPWKFVARAAAIQVATTRLKIGLDYALKPVVDGEAIENKAGKTVESIVETYREQLNRIYATDEIYGKEDLQKSVYKQFKEKVMKYAGKFHDETTQVGVGVATNVASTAATVLGFPSIGSIIQGGTQITMGAIKNAQADSKSAAAMREAISQVYAKAMSSAEFMKHDLNKDFSNNDDGNKFYAELVTQGYVVSNEINYRSCGDLNGIQLSEELVKYKEALVGKCNKIGELFTRLRDYSDLQNSYSVMVRELKTSIQENELLGGMTGVVAGEVAQKVVPPMMKKVGEFFKKTQQQTQSEHYEGLVIILKRKLNLKKGELKSIRIKSPNKPDSIRNRPLARILNHKPKKEIKAQMPILKWGRQEGKQEQRAKTISSRLGILPEKPPAQEMDSLQRTSPKTWNLLPINGLCDLTAKST